MSKTFKFILSKVIAIVIIIIGVHCLGAYLSKILPFGITYTHIGLIGAWAYMGWFISIVLIGNGLYLLFKEIINYWVNKMYE